MTPTRLIEGQVEDVNDFERDDHLKAEIRELRGQLADARADANQARRDATRALSALRQQLAPLYRALQGVFGELDAVLVDDAPVAAASNGHDPRVAAVWDAWKSRLGDGPAKVINALLLHGEMNTQQLAIACGASRRTIPAWIFRLKTAGLINKNGGRFSLKHL